MADVKLAFTKNTLSDTNSTTYSATKNANGKSCTIFVNDRTKNGFGKDDYFYYQGDISLFSQKEIKELIDNGADGKKYNANTVAKPELGDDGIKKITKMDNCKEMQEGYYYELGNIYNCAEKASQDQTFVKAEAKAAEAAKTTAPATPTASEKPADAPKTDKPAEVAKTDIPAPPTPAQTYNKQYYRPQGIQQPPVSYGPSPAEMMGTSALAGGAIGGFIGALFGGARGFFAGAMGGALGGLMSFCGMSALGGFGGGFGGGCDYSGGFGMGYDPTDDALNMTFANFLNSVSARNSYPMFAMQPQSIPESTPNNIPEQAGENKETPNKTGKA